MRENLEVVELILICRKEGGREFRLAIGEDMKAGPIWNDGAVGELRAPRMPPWRK